MCTTFISHMHFQIMAHGSSFDTDCSKLKIFWSFWYMQCTTLLCSAVLYRSIECLCSSDCIIRSILLIFYREKLTVLVERASLQCRKNSLWAWMRNIPRTRARHYTSDVSHYYDNVCVDVDVYVQMCVFSKLIHQHDRVMRWIVSLPS